jgi:hypothetical protein
MVFFCQKKEEIVYGFRVKKNEFGKKKCGNLNYQTSTYVRYTMYMPPHLFVATYTEIKICPPKNWRTVLDLLNQASRAEPFPVAWKFRLPNRISNPAGRGGPSCPWSISGRSTRCESPSRGLVTSRSSARSPYLARQLSVRKVVPTLTSNERWDLPLDGRC